MTKYTARSDAQRCTTMPYDLIIDMHCTVPNQDGVGRARVRALLGVRWRPNQVVGGNETRLTL